MKRRYSEVDAEEELSDPESFNSSEEEDEASKLDENEISQIVQDLPKSIPKQRALNLLHSMAASKDILHWNSHGEMTYHQRRIPITSMMELIEYALLPYNPDVRTPRGLKTFTRGLVELGINKHLIGNDKLLVDLVATQPESEDTDESDIESQSSDEDHSEQDDDEEVEEQQSSDDQGEEEEEEDEDEDEDEEEKQSMDEESDYDEDEQRECTVCLEPKQFLKISVVRCPTCHWHEGHSGHLTEILHCDICTSMFPVSFHNIKKTFYCCNDCNSIHRMSLKTNKLKLIVPKRENEQM